MPHQAQNLRLSIVLPQVYPRSFADSDGNCVGDLGEILDHLDYFELLGVDVAAG